MHFCKYARKREDNQESVNKVNLHLDVTLKAKLVTTSLMDGTFPQWHSNADDILVISI
jgi:hypothetical protein